MEFYIQQRQQLCECHRQQFWATSLCYRIGVAVWEAESSAGLRWALVMGIRPKLQQDFHRSVATFHILMDPINQQKKYLFHFILGIVYISIERISKLPWPDFLNEAFRRRSMFASTNT